MNVVIPAAALSPAAAPPAIVRGAVDDLIAQSEPRLEDQLAMDRWPTLLAPCARFVASGSEEATLALSVSAAGTMSGPTDGLPPLGRCLQKTLNSWRFPAGPERLYTVSLTVDDPGLARLGMELAVAGEASEGIQEAFEGAASDARACLPLDVGEGGPLANLIVWKLNEGERRFSVSLATDRADEDGPRPAQRRRDDLHPR